MGVFDLFVLFSIKPILYWIEKGVASKSIPNVSSIPNRLKLAHHPYDPKSKPTFDHSKWNTVLQKHVSSGATVGEISNVNVVDYASLGKDDDFSSYLDELKEAQNIPDWPPAEQLCFWINAYNALCINVIVQHEQANPDSLLGSITELSKDADKPVWDQVAGIVCGQEVSLNHIEHEQLRGKWDEPALHSCIVCASASCPNLRPSAFSASSLQEQMADQMAEWMSNDTKGVKLTGSHYLELSRIFLWFQDDFGGGFSGLQTFLPPHVKDERVSDKIKKGTVAVRYFEYDWSINRKQVEKVDGKE